VLGDGGVHGGLVGVFAVGDLQVQGVVDRRAQPGRQTLEPPGQQRQGLQEGGVGGGVGPGDVQDCELGLGGGAFGFEFGEPGADAGAHRCQVVGLQVADEVGLGGVDPPQGGLECAFGLAGGGGGLRCIGAAGGQERAAFRAQDAVGQERGDGGAQVVLAQVDGDRVVGAVGHLAEAGGVQRAGVVGPGLAGDALHAPLAVTVADQRPELIRGPGQRMRGLTGIAGGGGAEQGDLLGGVPLAAGDDRRVGGLG
jgi:hypothetical protein